MIWGELPLCSWQIAKIELLRAEVSGSLQKSRIFKLACRFASPQSPAEPPFRRSDTRLSPV